MSPSILLIRRMAQESEAFWSYESQNSRSAWLAWEARRRALLLRSWSSERNRLAKKILMMRNPHQVSLREACQEFAPPRFLARPRKTHVYRVHRRQKILPTSR
jgi:hypothetical protein